MADSKREPSPATVKPGNPAESGSNGLHVRVAMGIDAMVNLHQQLSRVLAALNAATKQTEAARQL